MWSYNSFYDDPNNVLAHSSHKYIDKYEKNGKTVYVYDGEYVANHPLTSVNKKTLSGNSTLRKYGPLKTRAQRQKDKQYYDSSRVTNAAKQAEKERRRSSDIVDINKALRATSSSYRDAYDSLDNLKNLSRKKEDFRQQDFDGMARDVYIKIKKVQKSYEDLIRAYENAGKDSDVAYLKKDLEEAIEYLNNRFKKYTQ